MLLLARMLVLVGVGNGAGVILVVVVLAILVLLLAVVVCLGLLLLLVWRLPRLKLLEHFNIGLVCRMLPHLDAELNTKDET